MSTYSPILRTELIGAGEQPGTWGSTTNSNFQYIFESAIAGYQAVTVSPSSNNQVLTYVNGPSAAPSLNQSIYAMLKLDAGSLGAAFNIYAPPVSKTYIIWNNTSYAATFYNSTVIGNTTPAGSGAVIPAGARVMVWSDGTSFFGNNAIIGNLTVNGNETITGTLGVTGTIALTGVATFTAAPVMSALTASSAVATDASKNLVSVANTGTGSNVLAVSPALTGAPTATTAAPGTNTTQIATTAFVQNVAGALGTMSSQNANAVAITGGTITGITDLAVADGGTGASTFTANAVLLGNGTSALQTVAPGSSGNILTSNGSTWTSAANTTQVFGSTWTNYTGSKTSFNTYTNNTGKFIQVFCNSGCNGGGNGVIYINGNLVAKWAAQFNGCGGYSCNMAAIVPPGATYYIESYGTVNSWWELV